MLPLPPPSLSPDLQKLNNWVSREPWTLTDVIVGGFILGLHLLCFAAPWTFNWRDFWLAVVLYCAVGCLGIDVSFHRCALGAGRWEGGRSLWLMQRACRTPPPGPRAPPPPPTHPTLLLGRPPPPAAGLRHPAACPVFCDPCRQLTHRSFATPKWLEYILAYLGTLGLEHDPLE